MGGGEYRDLVELLTPTPHEGGPHYVGPPADFTSARVGGGRVVGTGAGEGVAVLWCHFSQQLDLTSEFFTI